MHKQHPLHPSFENNFYDDLGDEEIDLNDLDNLESQTHDKTHHRLHARRSVDEYLERQRLRRRYKDLFDDSLDDID